MRYLKDFSNFQLFETNQVLTPQKLESDSKKAGLDLDDEQTQKLIADEIAKQLTKGEAPKLNFEKLARLAAAQSVDQGRIKEKKIYEKTDTVVEVKKNDIEDTVKVVEKVVSENKNIDDELKKAEKNIEDDKSLTAEEKAKQKSYLESFKNFLLEKYGESKKYVAEKLLKVLQWLSEAYQSIATIIGGVVAWVARNFFGLTNVQTKRVKNWVLSPIMTIIVVVLMVVFWQIIAGIWALSFASIASSIVSATSAAFSKTWINIGRGCQVFITSYFKEKRETAVFDTETGRVGDEVLFLGFLDRLETYLGRRFVIPPFARTALEKIDSGYAATVTTGDPAGKQSALGIGVNARHAKGIAKDFEKQLNSQKRSMYPLGTKFPIKLKWQWFQNKIARAFLFENFRLMNFLDNLFLKIVASGEKGFIDFKKLTGFPEGIPLISHIVNKEIHKGEPITKEVVQDFKNWLEKRWFRPIQIDLKGMPLFYYGLNPTEMTGTEIEEHLLDKQNWVKSMEKNPEFLKFSEDQKGLIKSISIEPKWKTVFIDPTDEPNPKTRQTFYELTGRTKVAKIDTEEEFRKNRNDWYNAIKAY